ncbi:hypothetical protein [Rhizobium sp. BK377]|uniref:hypothetical protein n=1 Tax=Rhizobium sp. BK377 TaxID=2587058 RepID=UPI00161E7ECF|nr:hypothetical protein [Rhizobium sp. BK377]MBB3461782.1 hypothetical protein [Rhizobium sp. BK377]
MFEATMMSARQDLEQGVQSLYSAFGNYPFPNSLDASPLREPERILANLKSAPLRELSAEALGPYAASAMTTIGSAGEFKHFLPRILHLALIRPASYGFEPPAIASKLAFCDWKRWPVVEQTAVANVFYAAWAFKRLLDPDSDPSAWDWILAMARLDLQFESCLGLWIRQPTPNAFLQLAGADLKSLYRGNGFWEDIAVEKRGLVLDWLTGGTVEDAVIGFVDAIPSAQQWQIDRLLDEITELRRLPSRIAACGE